MAYGNVTYTDTEIEPLSDSLTARLRTNPVRFFLREYEDLDG